MTESLSWDYWKTDSSDDGTGRILIYDQDDLDPRDIRDKAYDLDKGAWISKHYWNAEQAALISFGRDLDKIKSSGYTINYREWWSAVIRPSEFWSLTEFDKHRELLGQIDERYKLIMTVPEFTEPFKPAAFIDWASCKKLRIPDFTQELKTVDQDRNRNSVTTPMHPGGSIERGEPPENDLRQTSKKSAGPNKRYENNLVAILLAVLMKSKLIDEEQSELSRMLADFVEKNKIKTSTGKAISQTTISDRIEDAHRLFQTLRQAQKP